MLTVFEKLQPKSKTIKSYIYHNPFPRQLMLQIYCISPGNSRHQRIVSKRSGSNSSSINTSSINGSTSSINGQILVLLYRLYNVHCLEIGTLPFATSVRWVAQPLVGRLLLLLKGLIRFDFLRRRRRMLAATIVDRF